MIKQLQKLVIDRPITTSMTYLAVILFGAISLKNIPINLLPNVEFPKITIITAFPNSSPTEIENLITKPITETVGTINGIERIDSESIEGYSYVTIRFKNNKNINFAILEVRERIDLIREMLPQDASKPIITRFDPTKAPIAEIVFFSKNLSNPQNLRTYLTENVKVYMDRIDGVALVKLTGGYKKEILVDIDPLKMNSYLLSILEIKSHILQKNANYPAGQIPVGKKDVLVRAVGEYESVEDIGKSIITVNQSGAPVYLGEFSDIRETFKDRTGIARYNGKECVVAYIYKEAGKNTVEISENIHKEIISLKEKFGDNIDVELAYDESKFIKQSIQNLFSNLIVGSILAFIALLLILRNFLSPFILLCVIPASLFPTFLFFNIFDISLNMMSLGGLALGVGMLFDNSNVVLSGIERNLPKFSNLKDAVLEGVQEVTTSVFSATTTTVLVFLPIAFIKSIIGLVFSEMARAIVISLLMSLIISLTLVPMLASVFYKKRKIESNSFFDSIEKIENNLFDSYEKKLTISLKIPKVIITGIILAFAFSFFLSIFVKKEFIPKVDTGEFIIQLKLEPGTPLKTTAEVVANIETQLEKKNDIKSVLSNIGGEEEEGIGSIGSKLSSNEAMLRVVLKESSPKSTYEFIPEFRKELQDIAKSEIVFSPGGDKIGGLLSQNSGGLELLLVGDDIEDLASLGEKIRSVISEIPGVVDSKSAMENKSKEIRFKFDNLKLARYGFSSDFIANYLKTGAKGQITSKIKLRDYDVDIRIKFQKPFLKTLDDLKRLRLRTNEGEIVELSQMIEVEEAYNYTSILRLGNSRVNLISANLLPDESENAIKKIEEYVSTIKPPEGIKIQFSGDKENLNESLKDLFLSFVLAGVLIYMLLSGQFESLKYSLVMICTIPLVFIGIFPALLLTGKSINVSSFMGIILLIGIVVDNASLFYEYLHLNLKEFPLQKAIVQSGKVILRPVLMNNSTTILGMLPVVMGFGKGGEFQAPLGVVVISGLLSCVFLTLFLIPVLFNLLLKKEKTDAHTL